MPLTRSKQKGEAEGLSTDYLTAKLEAIHEDVRQLKLYVDGLRQESTGRKAVSRFIVAAIAIIGTTVGWLVDNAVSMAQQITITKGDK